MTYDSGIPGLRLRDHTITAPLDHADPTGPTIEVYAREVVGAEHDRPADLPWLVYLQGGPGGRSPRPTSRTGWLGVAVERYRVLLLDQRGTGRSTPLTPERVAELGSDEAVAAYAAHLREDAIVRDCEQFRAKLAGGRPWTTLGQSYGGFVTFAYLSLAPQGLERCLVTGGIPPIGLPLEEVYRRTLRRMVEKNREHHARWPGDAALVRQVAELARRGQVGLPSGDAFTIDRFQALGMSLGMTLGSAELHLLLQDATSGGRLTPDFLSEVDRQTRQVQQPLFTLVHEPTYSQGPATAWAAARVRAEFPELSRDADEVLFYGELIEPWRFEQEVAMRPYAGAAELLARKDDWPRFWDEEALAHNEVPVTAIVYHDDMFLDADASLDVARVTPHVRTWVTDQWEHDGLRQDAAVFTRLDRMSRGLE